MKELDLLLREYLDHHWSGATTSERVAFTRLLELPDPELAAYLLGHADADITLEPVLAALRGLSARGPRGRTDLPGADTPEPRSPLR
jgi:succinate dehydrogenase flavin-adding protein (antitoxin of CptAB toxin-antitoxin module)